MSTKAAAKPSHPPYVALVTEAIKGLKEVRRARGVPPEAAAGARAIGAGQGGGRRRPGAVRRGCQQLGSGCLWGGPPQPTQPPSPPPAQRSGSSLPAIKKYIGAHHKLPAGWEKTLSYQLKRLAASGKLVKVKASFKLSEALKKPAPKARGGRGGPAGPAAGAPPPPALAARSNPGGARELAAAASLSRVARGKHPGPGGDCRHRSSALPALPACRRRW